MIREGGHGIQRPACTAFPARHCLAVNDENQMAQLATLMVGSSPVDDHTHWQKSFRFDPRSGAGDQVLPGRGEKKYKEFDGEAVAYAAPYFFVVGSHGCGRNNQAFRLSSFVLARIRMDNQARPVDAPREGNCPTPMPGMRSKRLTASRMSCSVRPK